MFTDSGTAINALACDPTLESAELRQLFNPDSVESVIGPFGQYFRTAVPRCFDVFHGAFVTQPPDHGDTWFMAEFTPHERHLRWMTDGRPQPSNDFTVQIATDKLRPCPLIGLPFLTLYWCSRLRPARLIFCGDLLNTHEHIRGDKTSSPRMRAAQSAKSWKLDLINSLRVKTLAFD